ncbi:MAG: DNA methyltransferase [Cyanobacteria bacterium P01_H01_bin.105]
MPLSHKQSGDPTTTYHQYTNGIIGGTLILGDCIDKMRCMPSRSVDFLLTDPPYLVNFRSRDGRSIANDKDGSWLQPVFTEVYRLLKPNSFAISFYGWTKVDEFMLAWRQAGFRIVGHLTFVKKYASSKSFLAYHHESAFLLAKGNPAKPAEPIGDVLEFRYTGNKLHPTQKPVAPLRQLIRSFSKPGDVILDPFAGSGSTAVAAFLEKREFLTIEKMPEYFDIAHQRLEKTVKTPIKRFPKQTPASPIKQAV